MKANEARLWMNAHTELRAALETLHLAEAVFNAVNEELEKRF